MDIPDQNSSVNSHIYSQSSQTIFRRRPNVLFFVGELAVILLVIVIALIMNARPNDQYTEQDLNTITTALINQNNLPPNLEQLHVSGLHYSLSHYKYSIDPPSSNEQIQSNSPSGFSLCANFQAKGKDFPSDRAQDYDSYTQLEIFSFHDKGQQCFDYQYQEYGVGGQSINIVPVLSPAEQAEYTKLHPPPPPTVIQTYDDVIPGDIMTAEQIYDAQAKLLMFNPQSFPLHDTCTNQASARLVGNTPSKNLYTCQMHANNGGIDVSEASVADVDNVITSFINFSNQQNFVKTSETPGTYEGQPDIFSYTASLKQTTNGPQCIVRVDNGNDDSGGPAVNYNLACTLPHSSEVPTGFTVGSYSDIF